jgi:hypothetical protein
MSKEVRGGAKNAKASAAAAVPAAVATVAVVKDEKCNVCDEVVKDEDYGIYCEICKSWFHTKCEEMSVDEYSFLEAHKSFHWYCKACNKSVTATIQLFSSLRLKVENLEEKFNKLCDGILPDKMAKSIESKISEAVDKFETKMNKLAADFQGLKDQVSASDIKLETIIEAKLVDSVDSIKKNLEPSWASIVNKEVNTQFERVSKDVSTVQLVLEDTQKKANEERERESRSHNIIIYRVPEVDAKEERVKEDKTFCLELLNTVLEVDAQEAEFKFFRLGKRDQNNRPLMVQCREKTLKNRVMESLHKLKNAAPKFRNISVTHDLTINERAECKSLLLEAKDKQTQETGEYLWRVRGLPGQLKLVKLRKN